jgi:phosphoglycerate dehydrogenase-like enzyme
VIAHDPYLSDDVFTTVGVERVSFDALLRRSDVLMNQAPLTPRRGAGSAPTSCAP